MASCLFGFLCQNCRRLISPNVSLSRYFSRRWTSSQLPASNRPISKFGSDEMIVRIFAADYLHPAAYRLIYFHKTRPIFEAALMLYVYGVVLFKCAYNYYTGGKLFVNKWLLSLHETGFLVPFGVALMTLHAFGFVMGLRQVVSRIYLKRWTYSMPSEFRHGKRISKIDPADVTPRNEFIAICKNAALRDAKFRFTEADVKLSASVNVSSNSFVKLTIDNRTLLVDRRHFADDADFRLLLSKVDGFISEAEKRG